ncbi:YWFCY domain-containing protein [Chitinophaga sp. LS1]|uniref:YWFCY domain-containing protein n=1 Tax=Chitinophaga sp. LS1 TaxID=3051176 RepID=UPI002AAB7CAF|nr:YWFCY domain-containing protein [Chitinophaga sp. LS1]WPV67550.1 YWFCY domain-containing protein [Chitinophaga sp. LS1]
MSTGENEQGLRGIIDFLRKGSVFLLALHFYVFCYAAFEKAGLSANIIERVLMNIGDTGIFNKPVYTKIFSLILLSISLFGNKGKKEEDLNPKNIVAYISIGLLFYFGGSLLFYWHADLTVVAVCYVFIVILGYLLVLSGGAKLSRLISLNFKKDIFNEANETFPQQEELINNEYSINLPGEYNLKGKVRKMWINIQNPFRALLILGTPGSRRREVVEIR